MYKDYDGQTVRFDPTRDITIRRGRRVLSIISRTIMNAKAVWAININMFRRKPRHDTQKPSTYGIFPVGAKWTVR